MKRYYEAIDNSYKKHKSIFLAGGITDCPDWQTPTKKTLLKETNLIILNPRRKIFDIKDPSQTTLQIEWEWEHLKLADYILFWFPKETLCPITLLEYGKALLSHRKLFVGTHPDYQRRNDVIIQGKLERNDIIVHESLDKLTDEVIKFAM